jgi:hypothetical protein
MPILYDRSSSEDLSRFIGSSTLKRGRNTVPARRKKVLEPPTDPAEKPTILELNKSILLFVTEANKEDFCG